MVLRMAFLLAFYALLPACSAPKLVERHDLKPSTINLPQVEEQCRAQPDLAWCKK